MGAIAVAAISARALVEAAASEGYDVIALDLFGDRDTRRAAKAHHSIGMPESLRIDPVRLLRVLQALARQGGVVAWVAGSGFEGQPELLARGAEYLPLLGSTATCTQQLRDPKTFFPFLAQQGFAYPEVRFAPPIGTGRWLIKDAGSSGGWHIRAADDAQPLPHSSLLYWQREMRARSMSATFVANGSTATVLGINAQSVRPIDHRPFVFCGMVGPVPVSKDVWHMIQNIVRAVTARFELRGLASLDFLFDGEQVWVLEVNPRPPASMALYPTVDGTGIFTTHLHACQHALLPATRAVPDQVRGFEVIFSPRPMLVDPSMAAALADLEEVHDLPHAGTRFSGIAPVCSISACADHLEDLQDLLRKRRTSVLEVLGAVHA